MLLMIGPLTRCLLSKLNKGCARRRHSSHPSASEGNEYCN